MSRKIHWIIIHQSASNNPLHDDISVIREWHVNERNFSEVGYHFFIKKNGEIQKGRSEDVIGAHTKGHNSGSLGICLSGEGEKTPEQLKSLEILLIELCGKYELEKKDILAHADLAPTACPGFDVHAYLSKLEWQ